MEDISEKPHFSHDITTIAVTDDRAYQPYIDTFAVIPTNIIERDHGSLVGFFRLYDNSPETAYVAHFLTSVLKKEFYASSRRATEVALEAALVRVNTALSEFARNNQTAWIGKIDGVVAAFTTDTVCFSTCGMGDMLLLRDNHLQRLNAQAPSDVLTTFADIACGPLRDEDYFVIASREFLEVLPLADCERSCQRYTGAERAQLFRTALVNRTDAACAHLVTVSAASSGITRRDAALDIDENRVTIPANVFSATTFAATQGPADAPTRTTDTAPAGIARKIGHFYMRGNVDDTQKTPFGEILREHTVALRAAIRRQWATVGDATHDIGTMATDATRRGLDTATATGKTVAASGVAVAAHAARNGGHHIASLSHAIAARTTAATHATIRTIRARLAAARAARTTPSEAITTPTSSWEPPVTPPQEPVAATPLTTMPAEPLPDAPILPPTMVDMPSTTNAVLPDVTIDTLPENGDIIDDRPSYARHTDAAYDDKIASFFARTPASAPVAPSSVAPTPLLVHPATAASTALRDTMHRAWRRTRRRVRRIVRRILPSRKRLVSSVQSMNRPQRLRATVLVAAIVLLPLVAIRGCNRTDTPTPAPATAETPTTPPAESAPATPVDRTSERAERTHTIITVTDAVSVVMLRNTPYVVTTDRVIRAASATDTETFAVPSSHGTVTAAAAMDDLNMIFLLTNKRQVVAFAPQGSQKFIPNDITFPANATITAINAYLTYLYAFDANGGDIYRFARASGGFGPATAWLSGDATLNNLRSAVVDGTIYTTGDTGSITAYFKRKKTDLSVPTLSPALHADALTTTDENAPLTVIDRAAQRIVSFNKTGGTVVRNITHTDFATARTAFVDERLRTAIALLDDGTVASYKF